MTRPSGAPGERTSRARGDLRHRNGALSVLGVALSVALMSGCVAAPLMEGFLGETYQRVPPSTSVPDEPGEDEEAGETPTPAPSGTPNPTATAVVPPGTTESPEGAEDTEMPAP
ncbi:MAG: hypothetical protein ACTH31_08680 [Pseudoclavibacter sp.]